MTVDPLAAPGTGVAGAGLGLRRGMLPQLLELSSGDVDFMEIAPENWIDVGGRFGRHFAVLAERFPLTCHGLSLSIGSPAPLDETFVRAVKGFLEQHRIGFYSEHLSYCSDDIGHLYDLMPIPFTEEAVHYVAARIRRVQDILEQRIAIENVSYYTTHGPAHGALREVDFINAVLAEADCSLLLDVNNIWVNSINFRYDPLEFLHALDLERAVSIHVAGHYIEAPDLRIDTHGAAVIDPVWDLLEAAYRKTGPLPTLLERDFNFPPMPELLGEIQRVRVTQQRTPTEPALRLQGDRAMGESRQSRSRTVV